MQRKQKDVLPFGSVVSWQKEQTMKKGFHDWEMERVTRDSEKQKLGKSAKTCRIWGHICRNMAGKKNKLSWP